MQPALGPSRALGKVFDLCGTGRNVQLGHSCFSVRSGGQQVMVYRTGSYSSCIRSPCPLSRRICGWTGDAPPFPVRCAFSRWNSVHAALVFSSPQPESFGRGWVLWSSGLAGHAALGGRAMPCSCSPGKPLGAVSARRQYDGNRFCHRQPPFMRN